MNSLIYYQHEEAIHMALQAGRPRLHDRDVHELHIRQEEDPPEWPNHLLRLEVSHITFTKSMDRYKTAFLFPWNIGRNAMSIVQHGDKFELRINNQSFTHLWDNGRRVTKADYYF